MNSTPKIVVLSLNPCMDKTVEIAEFDKNKTNRVLASRTDIGGKGVNVARVLNSCDTPFLLAGLSAGAVGQALTDRLHAMGIPAVFCEAEGETRTNIKIIDTVSGEMTEINEKGFPAAEAFSRLQDALTAILPQTQVLVLSGSVPPDLDSDVYKKLTQEAERLGVRVLLDADGAYLQKGIVAVPYAVKPNKAELERLVGRELPTLDDVLREAIALRQKGISLVAVSLGAEGALFVGESVAIRTFPFPIAVGSAAAAGDSMVAMLALATVNHLPLDETARLMTAAGTLTASLPGTQVADYNAILRRAADIKTEVIPL